MLLPNKDQHMIRLSDTQRILLSNAAQRETGSVLPLPSALKPGGGTTKALAALLKHGLANEREITDPAAAHRNEGDSHFGLFLTPAGVSAIGVEPDGFEASNSSQPLPAATPSTEPASAARRPSKSATVAALLTRPDGATSAELIEATGWLPHTTRAALTGIRKKGHQVTRGKRDGVTCYRIAGQA